MFPSASIFFLYCIIQLSRSWMTGLNPPGRKRVQTKLQVLQELPVVKEAKIRANFTLPPTKQKSIVFIAGFEAFNVALYRKAAEEVMKNVPSVNIDIFTDLDIEQQPNVVENSLLSAEVLFTSLLFDFNKIQWIKNHIINIPTRFCFESSLELMSETKVGGFQMAPGGKAAGPPAPIKAILKQFGSKKEEDSLAGYLNFLKIGPKLLQLLPADQFKDLRIWLTVYSYWNQGALDNIISMFYIIIKELNLEKASLLPTTKEVIETPQNGLLHPDLNYYISSPKKYIEWYESTHPWVTSSTPRVAVLLYRKHVVTGLSYIKELITLMEDDHIMPVPVFINGVEAHTIVRDLLTTTTEQSQRSKGIIRIPSLSDECGRVDAVVNTIGFPLVGGPAGSMEGGRQADIANDILTAKNIPYFVAAPLLIQDVKSWQTSGVQGLQTVVLYSLPELDGAIEPIVLGGLEGETIKLLPERVGRLTSRLKAWVRLKKTQVTDRLVTVILYGFPPNVGAVATAALLDVGESLKALLIRMKEEGYDLGECEPANWKADDLISALRTLNAEGSGEGGLTKAKKVLLGTGPGSRVISGGTLQKKLPGIEIYGEEVDGRSLKDWLGYDLTVKLEKQWGELENYRNPGLGTTSQGKLTVIGLRVGKVFLAIQPLLGLEGDPMRLLFKRDLTPHPQYAAFYLWLKNELQTHVILHFGMHGTVEWLPGSPLGNTQETWPDKLLGDAPNIYLYACNNPSESILAKRRGYATILSHNVPPYARAGLYQQLISIKDALSDYRTAETTEKAKDIIPLVVATADRAGIFEDLPFDMSFITTSDTKAAASTSFPAPPITTAMNVVTDSSQSITDKIEQSSSGLGIKLTTDLVDAIFADESISKEFEKQFALYAPRLSEYLSVLENRLFSSGLHVLGGGNAEDEIRGYLEAVIGGEGVGGVAPVTLDTIAQDVIQELPSSSILLHARNVQQEWDRRTSKTKSTTKEERQVGRGKSGFQWGFEDILQYTDSLGAGVNYRKDLFTDEDKFGFNILKTTGIVEYFHFQWLRLRRAWNVEGAEQELSQLISIASRKKMSTSTKGGGKSRLEDAVDLAKLLYLNGDEEMNSIIRAMNGEYTPAGPGGDVVRDGIAILPTGRNIHALDPYRLPSELALTRGKKAAELILESHRKANQGAYPETVAVTLWGLDTIKTKGESVGILLGLVGAIPIREGTGRVVRFDLIPLKELGRPRIDVLGSLSGIFRDSFGNVLELLDDLFERAALAPNESIEENFIKKHTLALQEKGIESATSRLFSNPPGDFGSMVNEQVGNGEWENGDQLGNTWESRNAWSYGKGANNRGASRPELLRGLLNSTDRVIQEIDSVEYGLTDIQEYYANTGALKKAAEKHRNGCKVGVSVVEAFEKEIKPRELEDTLRMEYRSKLLNPKWATAMAAQGAGGAYEISGRMTAMLGWAGTAGFSEDWVYDGAAETYALDPDMAETLRNNNPEAFRNIVRRMLEAQGRGYWKPSSEVTTKLEELFVDIEDNIEGIF